MKKVTKILALILAAVTLLSVMAVPAFAEYTYTMTCTIYYVNGKGAQIASPCTFTVNAANSGSSSTGRKSPSISGYVLKNSGDSFVTYDMMNKSFPSSNYKRITDTPKTTTSRRVIPVPRQILPLLREQKKKSRSTYVVGEDKLQSVRSYQYSFSLLLKKLGIPHRGFHALRHTFATRALESGMDVKTLSEILGHKNPVVTLNRYAHSLMPHKHEAMNRLGKLF